VTGTSRSLTGLSASTTYQFQVRAVCASGTSNYGTAFSFSTSSQACSDNYEPNNARNNARTIPVNTSIIALIGNRYDQDWFRFANTTSARNIRVRLTGLPANYSLTLYRGATIVGTSNVSGTGSEEIVLNNATVSTGYTVRVAGVSGAFNATRCYTLQVEIGGTSFMPEGMPEEQPAPADTEAPALITNMYPNPAGDLVTLEWPIAEEVTTVELIDGVGRVVSATVHEAANGSMGAVISVVDHPTGLYFVRVSRGGGTEVRRLVVSR
ncbi:MAG: T9SS type A sorting domain-containing protein, partial [Flavobacteriales bacterium]|nr:T9SS type A sorting domain-containing protein [Flavobacteriales bacterium]